MHCYIGFLYKQIAALNLRHSTILLLHFCCKNNLGKSKIILPSFALDKQLLFYRECLFRTPVYSLCHRQAPEYMDASLSHDTNQESLHARALCAYRLSSNVDVFASCCEQIIVVVSPQVIESSRVVNAALPSLTQLFPESTSKSAHHSYMVAESLSNRLT